MNRDCSAIINEPRLQVDGCYASIDEVIFCLCLLSTILVVQVEQSIGCVCLCPKVCTMTFDLTCWFILTLTRPCFTVTFIGQCSRPQEEDVAEVVGATSTEGFLYRISVARNERLICRRVTARPSVLLGDQL